MMWGGAGRCPVQREARVPSSAAASSVGGQQGAVRGQVHAAGAQASALRTEALGALEKNTVPIRYLQSTPMPQSCHPDSCTPCLASQDSPGAAVTQSSCCLCSSQSLAELCGEGDGYLEATPSDLELWPQMRGYKLRGSQHCTWGPLLWPLPPVSLATQPPAPHTVLYQPQHSHCAYLKRSITRLVQVI